MQKKILRIFTISALLLCTYNVYSVKASDTVVSTHLEHEYDIRLSKRAEEHVDGERVYVCKVCGHTYTEKIEATGHIWSDWMVELEPTVDKEGIRYRVCTKYSDAPHYERESIPKLAKVPESKAKTEEKSSSEAVKNSKEAIVNTAQEVSSMLSEESADIEESIYTAEHIVTDSQDKSDSSEDKALAANMLTLPWLVELNAIDYASATGMLAVSWWYVAVIKPIVDGLIWVKRKKIELAGKLSKKS